MSAALDLEDLPRGADLPEPQKATGLGTHMRFTVSPALPQDVGRGVVRLDPDDIAILDLSIGDTVMMIGAVDGGTVTYSHARVMPAYPEARGQNCAQLDEFQCLNTGTQDGGGILIRKTEARVCEHVRLRPVLLPQSDEACAPKTVPSDLGALIENLTVTAGDLIAPRSAGNTFTLEVAATRPAGAVIIGAQTQIDFEAAPQVSLPVPVEPAKAATDPHLIGLTPALTRIANTVILPLLHAKTAQAVFPGLAPGVLLHGAAGCGKTVIGHHLRESADIKCLYLNAFRLLAEPETQSARRLTALFEAARGAAPALLFLDDLDAVGGVTPAGEFKEARLTAHLLTLLDDIRAERNIAVIGAVRAVDQIHPALHGSGRFERRMAIDVMDGEARRELFRHFLIASGLWDDIDLDILVDRTCGWNRCRIITFLQNCNEEALAVQGLSALKNRTRLRIPPDMIDIVLDRDEFNTAFGGVPS